MRKNSPLSKQIHIILELLFLSSSWVFMFYLRFYGPFPVSKGIPAISSHLKLLPFLSLSWILVALFFSEDQRLTRRSLFQKLVQTIKKSSLFLLLFISMTYFYNEYLYSRAVLLSFIISTPPLLILSQWTEQTLIHFYQRRQAPRKIWILVSQSMLEQALLVAQQMGFQKQEILGLIMVGERQAQANKWEKTFPVVSSPENWSDFFSSQPCETFIIALSQNDYGSFQNDMDLIIEQVPDIRIIPDTSRYSRFFSAGVDLIAQTPVISIHESPLQGYGILLKRICDIGGSIFALFIFSPIMLLCCVLVKLSSKGPIFYKQKRMGLDGLVFSIYKFRSMPTTVEAQSGAVWAKANDGRATRFGSLLRKTSLDELPQFFNVLRGDMSLVGPRPERPEFVHTFRKQIPGYMLRHKTKAGITGWAQVNGWRGDTSLEKRIECDLYYIQNWSLSLDFKILFLTVFKGFTNPNAY
ncbi:MAG: exopolysaccharide biosynthesis polyprenyl glycosylphosphotransferase [Oligoflexales bacterium]|nr:exopolysaccharide biosynthesis polyprenyl glycosylphosphotransferase [Oligoflexales bacterium]